MKILSKY